MLSRTELVKKLLKAKKCTVLFTKKNGEERVISGSVNGLDELGYLIVQEDLSNNYKKIDTRNLKQAIINGEQFRV